MSGRSTRSPNEEREGSTRGPDKERGRSTHGSNEKREKNMVYYNVLRV